MVYSKNQTKISFFGEFNENKLNYICHHEMRMAKRGSNTTKDTGNSSSISIGINRKRIRVRPKK
jgi:hypothetical protein